VEGTLDPDSGGFIAFLSPELVYSPRVDLTFQLVVRLPVLNRLNGFHEEGPFAALAAVLLNALRLRRLRPEALALGALALAMLAADTWLLLDPAPTAALAHWLSIRPSNALHLGLRALSLAVFAAGLLLHRQRQRAADLMGLPRPRALWVGLALIAGGFALQFGLAFVLDELRR
jgi:hypothetical protein